MHQPGGWVSWFARAFPPGKSSPPRGRPGTRRTPSPKPYGTPSGGHQGAPRLSGHAHAVRATPLPGPCGLAAGSHPGLHPGYLGIGGPPSRDGPGGACAPHGGHHGLEPARGLLVLGRPGAREPGTPCAGAPPPAPTPGPGQPSLPFLAPASGKTPGHFRGTGRRGGWPSLPRGTAGCLHRVGEVAAAWPHGRGHVDGGQGVGPRHADRFRLPPLRRGTRGQSPDPVGLPGVGKCQRDMASLAQRRGDSNPPPGAAGLVAMLPPKSGPIPPPTGEGRGPGTPTAFTACTWRSWLPAWQPATGTSRATGTPSSRTSRVRGPATRTLGTTSSAPCWGT